MKLIYPKGLKMKEMICDIDETPLIFDYNEFDYKKFGLFRFTNNGWFKCPVCNKSFLIEDYTNDGKKYSLINFLNKYDNFINRLFGDRDALKEAKELLKKEAGIQ